MTDKEIFRQPPVLTDEQILEFSKKVKGDWVTADWLRWEGGDFKAGILVGSEAQRDDTERNMIKQFWNLIGVLFWVDDDSKTAGLLVTGNVVYSHLQAFQKAGEK